MVNASLILGADVKLDENAFAVTIILTESQRLQRQAVKIRKFNRPCGGDGLPTSQLIRVDAGFMTDLAGT